MKEGLCITKTVLVEFDVIYPVSITRGLPCDACVTVWIYPRPAAGLGFAATRVAASIGLMRGGFNLVAATLVNASTTSPSVYTQYLMRSTSRRAA